MMAVFTLASASQGEPSNSSAETSTKTSSENLAQLEARLAKRYERLEDIILRLAELSSATDPRRAAVLRQVIRESNQREIGLRFGAIVDLLEKDRLGKALKGQENLHADLQTLLDLLLKEDRANRLESEKRQLRRWLKDVGRMIRLQRGLKARTEGGDELPQLRERQARLGEKAQQLESELQQASEETEKARNTESGPHKPTDTKPNSPPPGKSPDQENERPDGSQPERPNDTPPNGDQQPGQPGSPKPAGSAQGKPSPRQRLRERIHSAHQRMQQAEQQLEKAKRDGAAKQQEEAIAQLEQAKAELERILRQLREEEIERTLALLESRFRKMLKAQLDILEQTTRLNALAAEERDDGFQAGRLSRRETEIVRQADAALVLLREEGTAVAFPEAVEQMRADMQQVAARLAKNKTGEITIGLEKDIVTALEEMIASLQQAQREAAERQAGPAPGQPGQPQSPALVDKLAELRMIRALQKRVNTRTQRYSEIIEGSQAERPELREALKQLAKREQRIHAVTRDIYLEKNR